METERERVIEYITPHLRDGVDPEAVADEIMDSVESYNRRGPGNVVNGEVSARDSRSGIPVSFSV